MKVILICQECELICDKAYCYGCETYEVEARPFANNKPDDMKKAKEVLEKSKKEFFKVGLSSFLDCPAIIKDVTMTSEEILGTLNDYDFTFNGVSAIKDSSELAPCIGVALLDEYKINEHHDEETVKSFYIYL